MPTGLDFWAKLLKQMLFTISNWAGSKFLEGAGASQKAAEGRILASILKNICFNNFAQNSSSGGRGILALGLLLAVYGPGLGLDGPVCPEKF